MTSRPRRTRALLAVGTLAALVTSQASGSTANANAVFGVDYFISAPMVQGSYVTSGAITETFDGATNGAACGTLAMGVVTGDCESKDPTGYGGATTASSTPTFGGNGTVFGTTAGPSTQFTLTLTTPAKYLGFWWSAGSDSNAVTFYNGAEELLSLSTSDLFTLLGDSPGTAGSYGTTGTIEAANGTDYTKHYYFGHPRAYSSLTPTSESTDSTDEPFVYLHIFSAGGLSFDKVVFSGGGFEFDNLVVSDLPQTPSTDLVPVGSVESQTPPPSTTTSPDSLPATGSESTSALALLAMVAVVGGAVLVTRTRRAAGTR